MKVYQQIGYDGKVRKYVEGNCVYPYIYKQRKLISNDWIKRFIKLLTNAKYTTEQTKNIITHCIDKGYYIADNYYIQPSSLVQRVNDLKYKNLEFV